MSQLYHFGLCFLKKAHLNLMKLVYVTSFYPPDRIAGAELGTHFMAKHMANLGHEVHVLVTRPKENIERLEKRDGYQIHWLKYRDVKGLRFFSECRIAHLRLKKINPDIVHGNCLLPGGFIAVRYAKKFSCASVVLCYGYDISDMSVTQSLFGKRALRQSDQILAATQYCSNVIRKWTPEIQAEIFYAGYDDQVFCKREPFQFRDEAKILYIGRLIPEKGFDLLLKVIQGLPENYSLDVIGGGELKPHYVNLCKNMGIQKRVNFLGLIENRDLQIYLSKSHALVLPSLREPFGVVCIEAIASGTPVVCSKVMGLPEAVTHLRNGLVVEGRNVETWCESVKKVVEDVDFRKEIYKNSLVDREKWSWSSRLKELEEIYRDLINK